jgi:hypothetical protein
MRKIYTLLVFLQLAFFSFAQNIQQVNYRGAFAPAPEAMWTEGWANWDPENTVYPAANVTVSGSISSNTTWTRNNVYQLSGLVYVDSLVTLTIESGTIIRGGTTPSNASLIIKRGAKIIAEGTPCSPIVFTSGVAVGARSRGDWGGLIILGRAQTNLGTGFIEGLSTNPQLAYGGTDNADNSGILKYVRIELNGSVFAPNSEINGLTMGAVGSGTKIDYVQVSFNQDDAFEWFGGAVSASHLVSYRNLDDDFDTDNGFSGKVQFALAVRDPNVADAPSISTSEGFESDNDAGGSTNTPQTSAVFSNVTVIGPYRGNASATVAAGFRRGARIRRNSALSIFNSIFMDYATGLFIDGPASVANATNGTLKYKNNLVALVTPTHRVAENDATRTIFFANNNDSLSTTTGVLITPYNFTAPDYRPAAGSPALTNFDFSDAALPVELVKFYGTTIKKENVLYWETQSEVNNKSFEVMRSADGSNFSSIATISSLATGGNSSLILKYSFVDAQPLDGKSYYMLKQTDLDGRFTFSSVVVLETSGTEMFRFAAVFPNPTNSQLNLSIISPTKQDATVIINDMFGRTVTQRLISVSSGSNNYQINVNALPAGNYLLNVVPKDGSTNKALKFIKL